MAMDSLNLAKAAEWDDYFVLEGLDEFEQIPTSKGIDTNATTIPSSPKYMINSIPPKPGKGKGFFRSPCGKYSTADHRMNLAGLQTTEEELAPQINIVRRPKKASTNTSMMTVQESSGSSTKQAAQDSVSVCKKNEKLDEAAMEMKLEASKRKLNQQYAQTLNDRKRIKTLDLKDLPQSKPVVNNGHTRRQQLLMI